MSRILPAVGSDRTPLHACRCFELPANTRRAEHDAVLHKNSNRKLRDVVAMTGRLPSSTGLSDAEPTASVPAFARVIAAQGVMARMFGPKVRGLQIKFAPDAMQTVIVHASGGDIRHTSDARRGSHAGGSAAERCARRAELAAAGERCRRARLNGVPG